MTDEEYRNCPEMNPPCELCESTKFIMPTNKFTEHPVCASCFERIYMNIAFRRPHQPEFLSFENYMKMEDIKIPEGYGIYHRHEKEEENDE